MHILNLKDDLVFIVTPKAANSSIKHALKVWTGHVDPKPNELHSGWDFIPVTRLPEDKFVVATVRNPFDRLVSCWLQKIIGDGASRITQMNGFYKDMPFNEFVKAVVATPDHACDHHFKPMHYHIPRYNYLLRFETINEQWQELQDMFDLPDLPHLNASDNEDYTECYTPELIELVKKKYAKDLELYGYSYGA